MHPRNRYCGAKPDFARLARDDPRLAPHLTHGSSGGGRGPQRPRRAAEADADAGGGGERGGAAGEPAAKRPRRPAAKRRRTDAGHRPARVLDFTDPAALVALTRALLRVDFGLDWDMPLDRLCPTVTSRLNYLHWVEDLLALSASDGHGGIVRGLDIGTGASCIYPLLGVAMHDDWHFVATDIDPASLRHAVQNVTRNHLNERVALLLTDSRAALLRPALNAAGWRTGDGTDTAVFDFTMCNPPFFDEGHLLPASTATGKSATANETICPGGEVAFVSRIAEESAALPKSVVTWYSAMLGIRASLKPLVATLHRLGAVAVRSTRLEQGRTYRWALAWSFVAGHARAGVSDQTGDMGNVLRWRPRKAADTTGAAVAPPGPERAARNRYTRQLTLLAIGLDEVDRRIDDFVVDNDGWERVESGGGGGSTRSGSSNSGGSSSALPVWDTAEAGDDNDDEGGDTAQASLVSSSNGLRVRIGLTVQPPGVDAEIAVETIDSSRPLDMSVTARLVQRFERDLKRTGRYWRRRLAAQARDRDQSEQSESQKTETET